MQTQWASLQLLYQPNGKSEPPEYLEKSIKHRTADLLEKNSLTFYLIKKRGNIDIVLLTAYSSQHEH